MDLTKIKQIAFEQMSERSSHSWKERGNKYTHGERVARLALTLRQLLFPADSSHDSILTVAAWFHDIDNGVDDHCKKGAATTRALLEGLCEPAELNEITSIIAIHDERHGNRDAYSCWVKLHQDADLLDHFGTYEIWMNFLYAVPHDITLTEVVEYIQTGRLADDARYKSELNYELSRAIYSEKSEFVGKFAERFAVETDGKFFDLEKIIDNYKFMEGLPL
jgi:hypothetical protein